ncbi:MAG: hypothetical protein DI601_00195 [Azospirillum brasilense]|nr:MAG: hypothetical protein DI601_00195 [Azospirillum brasilense]
MFDGIAADYAFDEPTVFRDLSGRVLFRAAPTTRHTNSDVREWLTCLSLYGQAETRVRIGKSFSLQDGIVVADSPRAGSRTWRARHLGVSDVDSLQRALTEIANGTYGKALYVRGATPSSDWDANQATRLKSFKLVELKDGRKIPYRKGIDDAVPRHAYVADMDKVPNLRGHDPRKDPLAALAWLRSLLPPALASARCGYAWSSSTCVAAGRAPLAADEAPAVLSAHLIFWLDTPLDEKDLKALVSASRDHVRWRLIEEGMPEDQVPARPLDPATCVANQPIFLMAPTFTDMDDPLLVAGVQRRGMLDGVVDEVDVQAWRAELAVLPRLARAYASKKAALATGRSAPRKKVLRPASVPTPTDHRSPEVVAARLKMAFSDAKAGARLRQHGELTGYPLFASRAARTIAAVLTLRHPAGIPEGDRRDTALRITALLSFCTLHGDHLEKEFLRLAKGLLSQQWLDDEWWGTSTQTGLYAEAHYGGHNPAADDRLRYGRDSLIEWLEPTAEELALVGGDAIVLADEATRRRAEQPAATACQQRWREKAYAKQGGRKRSDYGGAQPWRVEGISRTEWYRRREAARAVEMARLAAEKARLAAERAAAEARVIQLRTAWESTPAYRDWQAQDQGAAAAWDVPDPPEMPADLQAAIAAAQKLTPRTQRRQMVW